MKLMALKVVPLMSSSPAQHSVLSELKALTSCDSEHVVKLYGAFLRDGNVNIALEYMDYGTL